MTDRFPDNALDLSLLPAPAVVRGIDFEAILAARMADFAGRMAAAGIPYDVGASEADPASILQEEDSYREVLDLQRINDAAKAVMILYARGSDQDNLFALLGLRRLTLAPARTSGSVAVPAVMEGDADFTLRAQVALDGTAPGLVGGGYAGVALRASPEVKRVSLVRGPEGTGIVHVVLQGRLRADGGSADDGSVSDAAVRAVAAALADDWSDDAGTGSQLTDVPMVVSAVPRPYDVVARYICPGGPADGLLTAQSLAGLAAATAAGQIVGDTVPTDALIAAGRLPSMAKFTLLSPAADVACTPFEVPHCRRLDVARIGDG